MNKLVIIIGSVLLFIGCSSLKVSVDYDPYFIFAEVKSFAIVHHNKEGENTLFNDRLILALEEELQGKAYVKSSKKQADLIFVFHTNVESKTDIDTDYSMVGYGRYGYGGHMMATTHSYKYTKGTLIIDALNPKSNKIVWRSVSTDILKNYDNPQERIAYIEGVIKESLKAFPSKLKSH